MRTLSLVLSLTAAAALTAGCAKKKAASTTPVATTPAPTQPAATAATTPAAVGEATVTTDDPTAPPSGPIYFELDSSVLTPGSRDVLTTFAAWAVEHKPKLRIEGHTDERGTAEYNLALGDRRARAVAEYLVDFGVDASRIDTVTYGEERPAAEGHDETAYGANRRGEVKTN